VKHPAKEDGMRTSSKLAIAASFVGVVVTAAAAFGQTGTPAPKAPSSSSKTARTHDGCGGAYAGRRGARIVHSDAKVKTQNGFANVTLDQGTVTAVDTNAHTITIKRADGESVTATAVDQTKVCKDGKKSTFDAIKVGDTARLFQIRSDKFTGLRRIAVRSPGSEAKPPARGETGKASPARAA
jgi:hypothetical protein